MKRQRFVVALALMLPLAIIAADAPNPFVTYDRKQAAEAERKQAESERKQAEAEWLAATAAEVESCMVKRITTLLNEGWRTRNWLITEAASHCGATFETTLVRRGVTPEQAHATLLLMAGNVLNRIPGVRLP